MKKIWLLIALVVGVNLVLYFTKQKGDAKIINQRVSGNSIYAVVRNVGDSADIQVSAKQNDREICKSTFYMNKDEQREIQLVCPNLANGAYSLVTYGGSKGILN